MAGTVVVFAFVFAALVAVVTAIAVDGVAAVDADDVVAVAVAVAAVTAPVDAVGVGGIVDPVLLAIKLTSLAMESDWWICGLLECKMFVKPPPLIEPFGESLVTTTDGARTRRGLKIADTSLSRVIVVRALIHTHTHTQTPK